MNKSRPSCEIHARYSRGCSECHRTEIDAFRAEVAAALEELRAEIVRLLCLADDTDDNEESGALAHLRDRLNATITALGLADEAQEEKNG